MIHKSPKLEHTVAGIFNLYNRETTNKFVFKKIYKQKKINYVHTLFDFAR